MCSTSDTVKTSRFRLRKDSDPRSIFEQLLHLFSMINLPEKQLLSNESSTSRSLENNSLVISVLQFVSLDYLVRDLFGLVVAQGVSEILGLVVDAGNHLDEELVDVDELVSHVVGHVREHAVDQVLEVDVVPGFGLEVEHGSREVVDEARNRQHSARPDNVETVDVDVREYLFEALHARQGVEDARDVVARLDLPDDLEVGVFSAPLGVEVH